MLNKHLTPIEYTEDVLQWRLQGSIVPTLRAVTLRMPVIDDERQVLIRFVVERTPGEAVEEVLSDVIENTISSVPSSISDFFDGTIEVVPVPDIIKLQRDEVSIFRRWEPGLLKLLAPADEIGMPTVNPPDMAQIAEVITDNLDGITTRLQSAAWARYWSWTTSRPTDYPSDLWEILEYLSVVDRFCNPTGPKVDDYWIPDNVKIYLQQTLQRLRESQN